MNTLCCHVEVISHPFSAGLCAEATHTICSNLSACKLLDQHSPPCTDAQKHTHTHTLALALAHLHLFSTLVTLPPITSLVSSNAHSNSFGTSFTWLRYSPCTGFGAFEIRPLPLDLSRRFSTSALATIFTSTVPATSLRPSSKANSINTTLETRVSHEHSPSFRSRASRAPTSISLHLPAAATNFHACHLAPQPHHAFGSSVLLGRLRS